MQEQSLCELELYHQGEWTDVCMIKCDQHGVCSKYRNYYHCCVRFAIGKVWPPTSINVDVIVFVLVLCSYVLSFELSKLTTQELVLV